MNIRFFGTNDSNLGKFDNQQEQQWWRWPKAQKYHSEKLKQEQALEMHKLLMQFKEKFEKNNENTYYILIGLIIGNYMYLMTNAQKASRLLSKLLQFFLKDYNKDLVIDYPTNLCFKYFQYREPQWDQWLKPNLIEGVDYIVIDKEINNFLNKYYRGSQIVRKSIGEGENKKVIVNLFKFNAVLILPDTFDKIVQGTQVQFEKEQLQVDENTTILNYYGVISQAIETFGGQYNYKNGVRLWRYTNSHKALFKEVKNQVQSLYFNDELVFKFYIVPIEISQTITFKQLNITDKDIIVVEIQSIKKPWCIKHPSLHVEGRCKGCGSIAVLNVVCVCKKVFYCNERCRVYAERFHLPKCNAYGSDKQEKQMKITNHSVRGITGLATSIYGAFINSTIQCLSNTYALSEYFIQNKYFDEINLDNQLDIKEKIVTQYGSLIKQVWCGNENVVNPKNFIKTIEQFQPIIINNSLEQNILFFITFLLNRLHEELNKVKNKPQIEAINGQGRTDFELAKESWEYHTARNQSIIVDLMHGQFKSTLMCTKCNNISITFNPFFMVELSIPINRFKRISINVIKSVVSTDNQCLRLGRFEKTMSLGQFAKEFIFPRFKIENNSQVVYFSLGAFAQTLFELTQEIDFVRKASKQSGLRVKILEPFEAKIDRANRIFLWFIQKAFEKYGEQYKRTIQPASFVVIEKDFTFKQIHIAIFRILLPIFCDLIQPNIMNVENLDEVRQYYEDEIQDKYYQVKFKSNVMNRYCVYCGNQNCNDCSVPYSDHTYEIIKNIAQEKNYPFQNIKPSEIYLYHQKQYQMNNIIELESKYFRGNYCVTLQDCLLYQEQTTKVEDDQYFCKQCKDYVRTFKNQQIYKASDILIFSLNKLKEANRKQKHKFLTYVKFPVNGLDLTNFILNKNKPQDYKLEANRVNELQNEPLIYDLYAVQGFDDALIGSYNTFACTKNQLNGKWYIFQDDEVSEKDETILKCFRAHLLFYRRRT